MNTLEQRDVTRATALVYICAEATGFPVPSVVSAHPRNIERGEYAPDSATIILCCTPDELWDVVVHEFQHHMDAIHGRPDPGGYPRGGHAKNFYTRMHQLEDKVRIYMANRNLDW